MLLPETDDYTFHDWLQSTEDLQAHAYNLYWPDFLDSNGEITDEGRHAFVGRGAFAAIVELVELAQEVGWKEWATSRHVNREQVIGEAVDVMHFLANILAMVQTTGPELTERYKAKQQKNLDRQLQGYTGADKCPECFRDKAEAYECDRVNCPLYHDAVSKVLTSGPGNHVGPDLTRESSGRITVSCTHPDCSYACIVTASESVQPPDPQKILQGHLNLHHEGKMP
jgi:dUTPase